MKKKPSENNDRHSSSKIPGDKKTKTEKVTVRDLKGKQVDADPSTKKGKPLDQQAAGSGLS